MSERRDESIISEKKDLKIGQSNTGKLLTVTSGRHKVFSPHLFNVQISRICHCLVFFMWYFPYDSKQLF